MGVWLVGVWSEVSLGPRFSLLRGGSGDGNSSEQFRAYAIFFKKESEREKTLTKYIVSSLCWPNVKG